MDRNIRKVRDYYLKHDQVMKKMVNIPGVVYNEKIFNDNKCC